tara:strand:+ start:2483 stop:2878 length:396 start_codon:yes stop_codon:yes gene_type:complete
VTSFSGQVRGFNKKTHAKLDKVVRFICLNLLRDVVMGTPVDTGRARANWQATIHQPAKGTVVVGDKAGGPTVSKGGRSIKNATGNVWWLSNNLPYIIRLEYEGHSPQAPSGWVRASVERAKIVARRANAVR